MKPESQAQLSQQIAGKPKPNNSEPSYPTNSLPREDCRNSNGQSFRRPLGVARMGGFFDAIVHQKRLSDTEKMQNLNISLTGEAKAALSGLGFSSQAYYQTRDFLCKKFARPRVIVESQLKKIYTHPPARHDDFSNIVRFSNVVTNRVNVLTRLEFQPDLKLEGVLSSATRKLSVQLKE